MKLETFAVEAWMTDHENCCAYNMADSCCAALSLRELLAYASAQERKALEDIVLDYGPIIGSLTLRRHIASLYAYDDPDSVTLAHGCINANELVLMTLLEPGDHVVTLLPTYQQLYAFPESLGCAVTKIALKEEMGWQADLQAICAAVTQRTRLICLNFPNNPTGTCPDRAFLEQLCAFCAARGIWILCDEVYQGLDPEYECSVSDLYARGVSTSSMSKTMALAGLRIGWIHCQDADLLARINARRDYHVISESALSDALACIAFVHRDAIMARSRVIADTNRKILREWLRDEPLADCVIPRSGTVCFLKVNTDMPSAQLCERLQEETGVFFAPGSCFGVEGHVRLGLGIDNAVMREGLRRFSAWLHRN